MSAETLIQTDKRTERQLVTFALGEEEFAFDIMTVQEIIRQPKLVKLPLAPDYVGGLANLRGMVMPIIDMRTRFKLSCAEDTDRTRILVLDVNGQRIGLRVDYVRQVARVEAASCEAPPKTLRSGMSANYLQYVVKLDEGRRMIMVLSPESICALEGIKEAPGSSSSISTTAQSEKREDADTGKGADTNNNYLQLVSFKLRNEEFAFPMECVREILRVQRISEVPDTPPAMLGILTVRGEILPVIDLRVLLGLPSLYEELYQNTKLFIEQLQGYGKEDTISKKINTETLFAIRKWAAEYYTSNTELADTVQQLRALNEQLIQLCSEHQSSLETKSAETSEAFMQKFTGLTRRILELFQQFQSSAKEHIRDDQRIIVVQTQNTLLALLVDKVREVLNISHQEIGAPPALAKAKNNSLNGIAKLEKGERLVMLLNPDNLLDNVTLNKISESAKSNTQEKEGAAMETEKKSIEKLEEQQFVVFRIEDGEYGIQVTKVQEIVRHSKVTKVPHTANYVDGITNLRGEVIPVVNARRRFELADHIPDERTRVLIIDIDGVKTGLMVDAVREVLNLPSKAIVPPPASLTAAIDRKYIAGIAQIDGERTDEKRMIIILDIEKSLNYESSNQP